MGGFQSEDFAQDHPKRTEVTLVDVDLVKHGLRDHPLHRQSTVGCLFIVTDVVISLARLKSEIFIMLSFVTSTSLVARSWCMHFLEARYSMPQAT